MTRGRGLGLLVVLALLVAALVTGARGHAPAAAPPPDPALESLRAAAALPPCPGGLTTDLPALSLPCFAGGPDVPVSRAPGRPLVVNLWATWCAPCVDEVPELVALSRRAGDRVGVVGVVHQDTPESVYAFARAFGISYPLLRDDGGAVLRRYGPGPPITLFVRPDGTVAHVEQGTFDSGEELRRAVARHLDVRL